MSWIECVIMKWETQFCTVMYVGSKGGYIYIIGRERRNGYFFKCSIYFELFPYSRGAQYIGQMHTFNLTDFAFFFYTGCPSWHNCPPKDTYLLQGSNWGIFCLLGECVNQILKLNTRQREQYDSQRDSVLQSDSTNKARFSMNAVRQALTAASLLSRRDRLLCLSTQR